MLEVDEAWLARVVSSTSPRVVALLNRSRDQLDRNNEVRRLSSVWRESLSKGVPTVVANVDDPLVVWGAAKAAEVVWVAAGQPWTDDASGCPSCGGRIVFSIGERGWACSECRLSRPAPNVRTDGDDVVFAGEAVTGSRSPCLDGPTEPTRRWPSPSRTSSV